MIFDRKNVFLKICNLDYTHLLRADRLVFFGQKCGGGGVLLKTSILKRAFLQVELEKELNSTLSELQMAIGPDPPIKNTAMMEDEPGIIHELTQVRNLIEKIN